MNEIQESNDALHEIWRMYITSCGGEILQQPGVLVAWGGVQWPILNSIFLTSPIEDRNDLERRLQFAESFTRKKTEVGTLIVCDDWMPQHLECTNILLENGWVAVQPLYGMVAEQLHPRRKATLEYRKVTEPRLRQDVAEINALCYEVPKEMALEALDHESLWGEGCFGYVGYAEGKAVATATTYARQNILYVALVATRPESRKSGHATAITSHSMYEASQKSGLRRTILHATPMARSIYEALGFRNVTAFTMFLPAEFLKATQEST